MTTFVNPNPINQNPYLRTSREFPPDLNQLCQEVDKSYIDVASAVNNRSIGLYPTDRPAVTGDSWYLEPRRRQQTQRQVFVFSSTSSIDHQIYSLRPTQICKAFGTYTDGTNSYGLLFGTSVAVAGLISFYITPTQIVFVNGAGAPALSSGRIVLEWLSNP